MNTVKLIKVYAGENNNKYYNMIENPGGNTFTAYYGRVGGPETTHVYDMHKWSTTYNRRIRHGYKDITDLSVVNKTSSGKTLFSSDQVQGFIHTLQQLANKSVSENYLVSVDAVTQKQIEAAQDVLNKLAGFSSKQLSSLTVREVNALLEELYSIIPRKMGNVRDYVLHQGDDHRRFARLLDTEQKNLDVMDGEVSTQVAVEEDTKFEDLFDIILEPVSYEEEQQIKKLLGRNADQYVRAFHVVNKKTQDQFSKFVAKKPNQLIKQFWHGSRNENWWSIMNKGLLIRPTNVVTTGSMFGHGIYFADKAQKSIGYTSLQGSYWARGNQNKGLLALYNVHLGNTLTTDRHESWHYSLSEGALKRRGNYDSLSAKAGRSLLNNEYIVYNQNQTTISYIVELR